MKLIYTEGLI